jgi:hypothetical protein
VLAVICRSAAYDVEEDIDVITRDFLYGNIRIIDPPKNSRLHASVLSPGIPAVDKNVSFITALRLFAQVCPDRVALRMM